MNPIGLPIHFSIPHYLNLIEQYIASDEVEIALWLLDHPPSFYRANPPPELVKMRDDLNKSLWTPIQYAGIYEGVKTTPEATAAHWPLRAEVLEKVIRSYEVIPHIMELGPGGNWLHDGLNHKGLLFTYESMGLDGIRPCNLDTKLPAIFVAFELIEHLHNEIEIYQNYLKFNRPAEVIIISTPEHTWAGGMAEDFRKRPLGHLRAYSPSEFHAVVSKMFHEHKAWELFRGDGTQILKGTIK